MEKNPWTEVALSDYENHMKLSAVYQLQTLDSIMDGQFGTYPVHSAAILGVAGGNGLGNLEHYPEISEVFGIDINPEYLRESAIRYPFLKNRYATVLADVRDTGCILPGVDIVIANLFVEYVGCACFSRAISAMSPLYVSCVIQLDPEESFVSESPYAEKLEILDSVHASVNAEELSAAMSSIGYGVVAESVTPLPNGKQFRRIDFRCRF